MKTVLVQPEIPGNTGFVARVMKNFEVKELILINPKYDFTLSKDEIYRHSVHARDIIDNAKFISSLDEFLKEYKTINVAFSAKTTDDYNIIRAPLTLKQFIAKLRELPREQWEKLALIFGRESSGLSNEELKKMNLLVTIPTSQEYRAMNLSHAVAVVLYEIYSLKLELEKEALKQKLEQENNRPEEINEFGIELATDQDIELARGFINEIIDKIYSTRYINMIQKQVWKKILSKGLITKREIINVIALFRRIKQNLCVKYKIGERKKQSKK